MTVTYTSEVATAKKLGIFWKLLFRWRGSIYKVIWPEMIIFILLYYSIRAIYKYALDTLHKKTFEDIAVYCQSYTDMIPLTFVLGFYVNIVMTRWWDQYKAIPWPDNLAVFVSTSIHGLDERGRLMRRTIMRYINLSYVITMSMISPKVKKRFPTYLHLVEVGLMTKNEKVIFEHLDEMYALPKYWMPLVWAGTITSHARKEGRIRDDFGVKTILDTINTFRGGCGSLLAYDSMSIPLVYTQVVTLAVYTFFMGTLMGRQYLEDSKKRVDLYVPWFSILQFLFYMGWLKVAETLINPFGEDDDDFEINRLIDRNIQISYLIVDGMHSEHPDLIQDKYWEEGIPQELPYTIASEQFKTKPYMGSTACMEVPQSDQFFLKNPLDYPAEEDYQGLSTPGRNKRVLAKHDEEMAKVIALHSITEEKDERSTDEDDDESILWITPTSLPKNPSILSFFKQLGQNPPRRLSRQISSASGYEVGRDLRKNESVRTTRSPRLALKPRTQVEKKDESQVFHLSLDSLQEEQTDKTEEEDEEVVNFLSQKDEKEGLKRGTNEDINV